MCKPLITVIVPVYKVEKYLEKCVKSILNQTYENLEIILVDDGSPDNCGAMCDKFAKQDSRIRVIHKENGGLSSARNAGLDVMAGEYVGFVDSDDWIEPTMYEGLLNLISVNDAQIAVCGLQCDYEDGKIVYFNDEFPQNSQIEIFTKVDALRELILTKKITNSACDKLFCRHIFQKLRFRVGTVNEDFDLMPKCIEEAEIVAYDPNPFYHYNMIGESITRGGFKKSRFTEAEISKKNMLYYKDQYPQLYSFAVAKHIEICLNLIQASAVNKAFSSERKELIKEVKSFKASVFFGLLNKRNKIKYILFSLNTGIFTWFMTHYYNSK